MMPRVDVLERCRKIRADENGILVGAAIGAGLMAEAATRGGVDLLIAITAGRFRMMGGASLTCMMPIADSNALTARFARSEILNNSTVPVFFGANCMDPRLDLDAFLNRVRDWGFSGVTNFPSALFVTGGLRDRMEAAGIGFGREVELVKRAKEHGLATIAYVQTPQEARVMAQAPADIVNVNLGWNQGGTRGVASRLSVSDAGSWVRHMVETIGRANPDVLPVIEGGPITTAEELVAVCREARALGYIGGSTIDRMPLEDSVSDKTSSFKTMHVLRSRLDRLEQRLERSPIEQILPGTSDAVRMAVARTHEAAGSELPVLIIGEPGTGRRQIARAIHRHGRRRNDPFRIVGCAGKTEEELAAELFGHRGPEDERRRLGLLEVLQGGTLAIADVCQAPAGLQTQFLDMVSSGRMPRSTGGEGPGPDIRLLFTARPAGVEDGIDPALHARIGALEVSLPPLRERPEDIPLLARQILDRIGDRSGRAAPGLDPAAHRALISHGWPGNLDELHHVLTRASMTTGDGPIAAAAIKHALGTSHSMTPRPDVVDEKSWLLDGLRRNRFRRKQTAAFLGISRKTLYNKMKRHGLLST